MPFAGDNNFLFDRIDILDEVPEVFWYVRMQPDDPPMRGSYRLTVGIDRADNSKTTRFLSHLQKPRFNTMKQDILPATNIEICSEAIADSDSINES